MTESSTNILQLDLDAAAQLVAWHAEARRAGVEPCGYLLGLRDGLGATVTEAQQGTNVHPQPARAFRLAPEEHLAAKRAARSRGLQLVGLWHGHLVGPAQPSRADAEGLGPLGPTLMLIVVQAESDPPQLGAWRRVEDAWQPLRVVVA